jgi:Phosphotransferase enzyme family
LYSSTPSAQNQIGARHSASQHIALLKKWLSLAPAVLPLHEHRVPTLSHPDLHAANIFVNDDNPISVTAIIDWQGAAIRPLFETIMPDFVNVDTKNLKYAKLPGGDLQDPVLPDNFDELDVGQKSKVHAEIRQVVSNHRFLELVRQLRPGLYAALQLHQMEDLRRAIYYSSHSWSDGLPLLERCLLSLTARYGNYIPASTNYPVSPVLFSEDDVRRHEKEFKDIIHPEEWLDVHIRALMMTKGIVLHRDGSVDSEDFEEARKKADESFVAISTAMDEERAEKFRRHWPMRAGKFVLSMESCMYRTIIIDNQLFIDCITRRCPSCCVKRLERVHWKVLCCIFPPPPLCPVLHLIGVVVGLTPVLNSEAYQLGRSFYNPLQNLWSGISSLG